MDRNRWGIPPSRRVDGLGAADARRSFLGGMRLMNFNATLPLVRLSLLPAGLRMEASVLPLRPVIPVWEARYDDLIEVQAVGVIPLFSEGIRFGTRSTGESAVFWASRRSKVIQAIADRGVRVNPQPIRFRSRGPDR